MNPEESSAPIKIVGNYNGEFDQTTLLLKAELRENLAPLNLSVHFKVKFWQNLKIYFQRELTESDLNFLVESHYKPPNNTLVED